MCFSGIYESSARCLPTEAKGMAEVRESKAESLETPEDPQNPAVLIYIANQYFLWFCLKGLRKDCGKQLLGGGH